MLRWSFLALLAAAAAWYVMGHRESLLSLRAIPPASLALLLLLALSEELLQGMQLRLFCGAFDLALRFREWFGLTICNSMYDYFVPGRAASGARAYYLKKVRGLTYAHFGAIFVVSNVLNLSVASFAGAAACLIWSVHTTGMPGKWLGATLTLMAVPLAGAASLIVLPKAARHLPIGAWKEKLQRFGNGMEGLLRRADVLMAGAIVQSAKVAASAAGYFICCRAVGGEISYVQAVIVQSVGAFTILLPLTPGGLGIREGFVSYLSYLVGLPVELAMLAALIQRAASMAVVFGFGLYFSHSLTRELGSGAHGGLRAAASSEQADS